MISCPAANGIICSSWRPSATLAPSGTSSAIASRMEKSLAMLLSRPPRLAFLQKSLNTFLGVVRLHQIFEIDLLRPGQPFVEVHRVPCVDRFFGYSERCGA